MADGSIAAGAVAAFIDFSASKGADREKLMQRADIAAADIEHPDDRIPFSRYVALMRASKELTGDPALALHFGEAFDLTQLSIIGLMAQACETVEDAFARLGRFNRLLVDVELEEDAHGERYVLSSADGELWFIDKRTNPNEFPELTESSLARMMCTARRMSDRRFVKEVHVTHSAPPYRDEYDRILGVPVVFDSERNGLLLTDDSWMTQRSPVPSPYVLKVLMERAEAQLKHLDSRQSTRAHVERILESTLHSGGARMASVAKALGVSRATLLRRLRNEATTFEEVRRSVRTRLAHRLLGVDKLSVKETAFLLGFSDAASFSRAFKRWTGSSPGLARG